MADELVIAQPAQSASSPRNSEFLRELLHAAPRGTHGWVVNFPGAPRPGADWRGLPYQGGGQYQQEVDTWQLLNTYTSVAALFASPDGELGRLKRLFARLLALVVDDVQPDDIHGQYSWLVETSPGKHQVGIFLDAVDADCANLALVDAVMRAFFERGLMGGDRSGNNGVRLVRLPEGTNHKERASGPFRHRVTHWKPEYRVSLADACQAFGLDLDELRGQAAASRDDGGLRLGPGMAQDEKLAHLAGNILRGEALHDSINEFSASMAATSMPGGAIVNVLRGMMAASLAPRDARFRERYDDIPRSVRTAQDKFQLMPPLQMQAAPGEPEIPDVELKLLVRADKMMANMQATKWLIDGYLEAGAMSMLFGPPAVGKSFIAFDQACCVATGTPWHGNAVEKGAVIVVAGEGQNGAKKRCAAWAMLRKVKLDDAPLYFTTKAVPVLDRARIQELVAEVDQICRTLKGPPKFIVIDTLARNFGAGDENSAKDASAFIEALDECLRLRYSWGESLCHILIVHHSGLVAGRARGSTAFKGAMDQEFGVKWAGTDICYSNVKMKDAEKPRDITFELVKNIYLGDDDRGSAILGAALKKLGGQLDMVVVTGKAGPVTALKVLELVSGSTVPGTKALMAAFSLSKDGVATAYRSLVAAGLIEKGAGSNAKYTVTEAGAMALSHTGWQAMGNTVADGNEEDGSED